MSNFARQVTAETVSANAPFALRRQAVVVSELGPEIDVAVASCESRPALRPMAAGEKAWRLIERADVLLARPFTPGWEDAPSERPAGWPGPIRWVMTASTGVDFFPPWLTEGPIVTCARGVPATPIAEYALAAILLHAKRFEATRMRGPKDFRQTELASVEGQTLGLAGYGAIGQALAPRSRALGMRVLALRRSEWSAMPEGVEPVSDIRELARRSDHLVLALPATPDTHHLVNAAVLVEAKPSLHLVNVARGSIVDHDALLAALDKGLLAAATLDVTDPEPLPAGHPFYTHPAVRLTPHISWASAANKERLIVKVIENLDRYARGQPLLDVVDPDRGY